MKYDKRPKINFIPLLDVSLVIIIIISCAVDFNKYRSFIVIDLPTASSNDGGMPPKINVAVNKKGIFLDGVLVTRYGMGKALKKKSKDSIVSIEGERNISYQHIMKVIDMLKTSGFSRIVLVVRRS